MYNKSTIVRRSLYWIAIAVLAVLFLHSWLASPSLRTNWFVGFHDVKSNVTFGFFLLCLLQVFMQFNSITRLPNDRFRRVMQWLHMAVLIALILLSWVWIHSVS
jgi:hypothetical protein